MPAGWSHAAVPVVYQRDAGLADLYFSSRDERGYSHVMRINLLLDEGLLRLAAGPAEPVLHPGAPGFFDDAGVMACCIVSAGDLLYLYYIGWNRSETVPFRNALGVAFSRDRGCTWARASDGPILDRSVFDPAFVASATVAEKGGEYLMWYTSGIRWEQRDDGLRHYYNIKIARSSDALTWRRDGEVAIDFDSEGEYAITCPSVVPFGDRLLMWFCSRGDRYSIAAAESPDGIEWRRISAGGLRSSDGASWESDMACYPRVLRSEAQLFLLYNGNGFGRTGIGYATAGA